MPNGNEDGFSRGHTPSGATLEERTIRNEANIQALGEDMQSMSRVVTSLAETVKDGFDKMQDRLSESTRPNYGTMAAWAAVVLAVAGLWSAGYLRDQSRLESDVATMKSTLVSDLVAQRDEAYKAGATNQRLETLEERFEEAHRLRDDELDRRDDQLRREMELLVFPPNAQQRLTTP